MEGPPPTLTEPKEWSADFATFLEQCLRKEPAERPSAVDLLLVRARVCDAPFYCQALTIRV